MWPWFSLYNIQKKSVYFSIWFRSFTFLLRLEFYCAIFLGKKAKLVSIILVSDALDCCSCFLQLFSLIWHDLTVWRRWRSGQGRWSWKIKVVFKIVPVGVYVLFWFKSSWIWNNIINFALNIAQVLIYANHGDNIFVYFVGKKVALVITNFVQGICLITDRNFAILAGNFKIRGRVNTLFFWKNAFFSKNIKAVFLKVGGLNLVIDFELWTHNLIIFEAR